jgi:hypothetical protein
MGQRVRRQVLVDIRFSAALNRRAGSQPRLRAPYASSAAES